MELPNGTVDEKLEYLGVGKGERIVLDGIEIDVLSLADVYRFHLDAQKTGCVYYCVYEWDDGQMDEIMRKVGILF